MYLFKKLLLSFAVVLFTCGTSTVYLYYLYRAYYSTHLLQSTQYGRSVLLSHDLLHRPSKSNVGM